MWRVSKVRWTSMFPLSAFIDEATHNFIDYRLFQDEMSSRQTDQKTQNIYFQSRSWNIQTETSSSCRPPDCHLTSWGHASKRWLVPAGCSDVSPQTLSDQKPSQRKRSPPGSLRRDETTSESRWDPHLYNAQCACARVTVTWHAFEGRLSWSR